MKKHAGHWLACCHPFAHLSVSTSLQSLRNVQVRPLSSLCSSLHAGHVEDTFRHADLSWDISLSDFSMHRSKKWMDALGELSGSDSDDDEDSAEVFARIICSMG